MENPYAAPQGEIRSPIGSATPLTWKQILFSFEGRIPRRQYWAGFGIQMAAILVIALVAGFIIPIFTKASGESSVLGIVLVLMGIPIVVFAVWIGFAVGIKRWHDRGKSGWWMLIGFIPYIGGFWTLLECGCARGTEGANNYGEDPT